MDDEKISEAGSTEEGVTPGEAAGVEREEAPAEEAAAAAGVEPVGAPRPSRLRYLLVTAISAGVLLFALAFFMAGFAAHTMLEDEPRSDGQRSASTAAQADDPAWGPEGAAVTIEAFSDFQCPYCKKFAEETLPLLRETYGEKVRFVFRDYPLASIHPLAAKAAEAAGCVQDQGLFWEYHDLLYKNQESLSEATLADYAEDAGADLTQFNDCLASSKKTFEVLMDVQDAQRAGINGTPAFLVNGLLVSGAQPFELFQSLIDQTLAASQ